MTDSDGPLAFESLDGENGLEILDRIEQERCVCRTDAPVNPTSVDNSHFRFPVDHAVRISARELCLPNVAGVLVRDSTGTIISQIQQLESEELQRESYSFELLTQFKTYLSVTSSADIVADATEFKIDFGSNTDVVLGSLSNHQRPAEKVQTTEDPVDMMAAIETFSSALKTTSPDRAFPSLRGHPPGVDIGNSLSIPDSIESPDTGITLEIPARRDALYVVAPLAYYLGADLEPGPIPRIVTEEGFEYTLSGRDGFESTVERTLKQVFFLDCITRTEGLYQIDLHERRAVEQLVELDFESLYDQPLQAQVARYLDVPYEVIESEIPEWRLTTHVEPEPKTIEQLPFVVDDLAVVRTESAGTAEAKTSSPTAAGVDLEDSFTRSASTQDENMDVDYIEPKASDSLEQAWIGEDIPVGASKLTREAFENRLDLDPVNGDITITIVQNDQRMDEERNLIDHAYGNRENLPFDIDVNRQVTTGELREILREDRAFLHYIGHTEHDGFECPDGKLDVRSLDQTGIQAFLLNACNSYEQGLSLIQAGAVGGIVTLNDILNDGAVSIGVTIARLLNGGFPLRSALAVAREESIQGGQYIVVGDGGMTVAQPSSGFPNLLKLSKTGSEYLLEIETFSTDVVGLGALYQPYVAGNEEHYLGSGETASFRVSEADLKEFLHLENVPVRVDGDLYWSQSFDLDVLE